MYDIQADKPICQGFVFNINAEESWCKKMYQVVKRDGKVVEFEITKIAEAIRKAFEAQNRQYHPSVIDFLALRGI